MGAKYKISAKLSKQERNELFIKFAKAIASLHNPKEVAHFLKDLLSEAEVIMLAKRLQIADLLIQGLTYEQIRQDLKVSDTTIARVQTWLMLHGEGYRIVINRVNKPAVFKDDPSKPFAQLKRKYPMYFWPELLLKEIIKAANKKEKERLLKVIDQLREKTALTKELNKLLGV